MSYTYIILNNLALFVDSLWMRAKADGIYFNVRLSVECPCVLVLIGATADGRKEVIAIDGGQRKSKLSWQTFLQGLETRGLKQVPAVAVGDGALELWTALEEEFPVTKHQQ